MYSDATKPTVTSFTTDKANGAYNSGENITITANTSELVLKDSTITVTLDTSETVTLTAASNGTTLTGVYTVGSLNSPDLNVSSFALVDGSGDATAVVDKFGNTLSDTSAPTGANSLAGSAAIVIDNIPIVGSTPITSYTDVDTSTGWTAGDEVALIFSETVANKTDIATQILATTSLGTAGAGLAVAWTNSDKTATITTGSDMTIAVDGTIPLTGIEDAAGNTNDITFTLDLT